ncbi:MAG: hypothetical protein AMJ93_16390, partial [Anaerolineae bacterium SM23_84]
MRHRRACICLVLLVVFSAVNWAAAARAEPISSHTLAATQVTLYAIADASVNSASPGTNYGTADALEVQAGARTEHQTLLRF